MNSYQVKLNFNDGIYSYDFPLVQDVEDNIPGTKDVIIEGNRADGSLVIPGGKKSIQIKINGILFAANGYVDLTTLMSTMRSNVTTNPATLTLSHYDSGWQTDWSYSVKRIGEIIFPKSEDRRTQSQNYEVTFLVIAY